MNAGIIAAFIAANAVSESCRREEQDKEEQKQKEKLLLLKGDVETMELGLNETVKAIYIHEDYGLWRKNGTEEEGKSLTECLQTIVEENKAKAIQLLPRHVNNYNCVDAYTILLKIELPGTDKINVETSLKNIEDRMREEIKTAW